MRVLHIINLTSVLFATEPDMTTTEADPDFHWLVGIMEGEGCFTRQVNKGNGYSLRIILKMTDEDIVRRAHSLFECGSIYKKISTNPKHSDSWTLQINGPKANALMLKLQPFMGIRRSARIEELINEYNSRPHRRSPKSQR